MSSSSQKWFKEIENEIINRNKECNSLDEKKIYEYDRHEINPYKLKDVNKFKRDYTFDKKKNCRLIIDNIKQITDKNNRYYKNVFTQDRCNTTNGFWVGNTINRNTGYDLGNCWVDGDDAKCGSLIKNNSILRKNDIKKGKITSNDISNAKKECEKNARCVLFKDTNIYDCISKRKKEEANNQLKLWSDPKSKKGLEYKLYKLYTGKKAPKTLELIGTGNRCIDTANKKDNEIDEIEEIEEINKSNDNTNNVYENLNKYEKIIKTITNEQEKLLYQQNLIRTLDPNDYSHIKILKSYFKQPNDLILFNQFKKDYNTYNDTDENAMEDLYKYYFPTIFFIKSKSLSKSISKSSSGSDLLTNPNKKTLPSVPQSIVNNICKMITKNIIDKKGMLLWHSTGSGKTCTATAIMDGFWKSSKKIIYCSSIDALASNPPFKFHECAINLFKRFDDKSLNDLNNDFKSRKIEFLSFAKLSNRIEKKIINLNDCILIIDEVHNLFRPLPNQKKQHEHLEKLLLSNKYPNLNVFILTATLGDNPNEIMKLLNIVKNHDIPEIKFEDIENPDIFKEKIRGIISYFDMSSDNTKFPLVIDNDPEYLHMTDKQFEKYIIAYKDVKETAKDYDKLSKANSLNKYWAAARRYSNMLYNYEKDISLNEFSAKLPALIQKILLYPMEKQYVYSAFYENRGYGGHGILAIAKEFEKLGYERLTPSQALKIVEKGDDDTNKKRRFILAVSTQMGTNKGEELSAMVKLYNSSMNKYGEYVGLFLASQNYNEGIDLKAVRHIHIFEPLITWASDKQTIGRAARYCSHIDLDKNEWNVIIHRYISDLPDINAKKSSEKYSNVSFNGIKRELEELLSINYKQLIKDNKEKIKDNAKKLKILNKNPDKNSDEIKLIEIENERLLNNVKDITSDEIKNKERIKNLKLEIKKLEKKEKAREKANEKKVAKKGKKIDATDVINIDEFIYKQSREKMKQILTLYQYMKEAAIDCQVLNDFHKSGNQIIECHKY